MPYKNIEDKRASARRYSQRNKEKRSEAGKRYYASHRDEIRARHKENYKKYYRAHGWDKVQKTYRESNPEKIYNKNRKYRLNNLEYYNQKSKEYRKRYPDRVLQQEINYLERQSKKLDMTRKEYKLALYYWGKAVALNYDDKCAICGDTKDLQAHHIKSKAKYPKLTFDIDNGILLCRLHHKNAHDKLLVLNVP